MNRWKDLAITDQGASGKLPPKQKGQHRWIATAVYTISDEDARAAHFRHRDVLLDHEVRLDVMIGCLDCEEPYTLARKVPCPAEGYDWYGERGRGQADG